MRNPKGYAIIVYDGKMQRANRVVCRLAHGDPPSPTFEAAHSCGVRECVNPAHLSWRSRQENIDDISRHGTRFMRFGSDSATAKLTEENVRVIRLSHTNGVTVKDLAAQFSVTVQTIYYLLKRRTWAHI
jgi:hypothetical protein